MLSSLHREESREPGPTVLSKISTFDADFTLKLVGTVKESKLLRFRLTVRDGDMFLHLLGQKQSSPG